MNELHNIWANARYELITLLRGWFFRIFAGLMLALFILIDIIFFSGVAPVPRMFYGLSSSVPYANMLMLNVVQMGIIIFLASDFFKRDRKFNTAEVFYIRSMTNASYITGKALGISILFLSLDVLILIIGAVIHIVFSDSYFNWRPYLVYPLIIGIPSFVFITGISFLLMRIIRNQAVVILGLLGYYAAILFYLNEKVYYLFDFVGMMLPYTWSDFTGISDLNRILLQRGLYFVLGVLCILVTILTFQRLAQSRLTQRFIVVFLFIFTGMAVLMVYFYIEPVSAQKNLRSRMRILNERYLDVPNAKPLNCRLEVYHEGETLKGTARYRFTNAGTQPLQAIYFCINPGLSVNSVQINNTVYKFHQSDHIVDVQLHTPLLPGEADSLSIGYSGTVDDAACFLDADDHERNKAFTIWLFRTPRKGSFLQNRYALLSPESMWYPRPGLPQGTGFPDRLEKDFVTYTLKVHTDPGLTAVSQGEAIHFGSGAYLFKPEFPLPALSLVIGPYKKQSIRVDSVDYHVYAMPGHDYYKEYLPLVGDTLENVIRDVQQDFEVRLNLDYPYRRLSLVEVPVAYYVYPRIWTVAQETVQPEQVWVQENLATVTGADFSQQKRFMERRFDRSSQTVTELESQVSMLKSFLAGTFCGSAMRGFRFGGPDLDYQPDYNLFPNYYSYITFLQTDKWRIFNTALESYLYDRVSPEDVNRPAIFVEGLTDAEKVSRALSQKSLSSWLAETDTSRILTDIIKQKGAYIVKLLQQETGAETFNNRLREAIDANRYGHFDFDEFLPAEAEREEFNPESYLENWYHQTGLPAFLVYNVRLFKVVDRDRIRNQILFRISNSASTDGLIEVTFQYARMGRGMPFGGSQEEEPPRLLMIRQQTAKEIGILLDEEPRVLNINFMIARNLPVIFTKQFDKVEMNDRAAPYEGERILDETALLSEPGEIIVDNADEGFDVFNPPQASFLRRLIHGKGDENKMEEYIRFQWWRPPGQWSLIKNASLFGTYIHSGYYIGSGKGERKVVWTADLPANGFYDIYVHMMSLEGFLRGRGRGGRESTFGDFNYIIRHDAGTDRVTLDAEHAPEGWNFLGTWYFSAGKARVELGDESKGRIVVADAVKWVKD